jgi:MFS superfamily sulfate permease-like transporter
MNRFLKTLKKDIPAGIIVFLVALPLCMGIAMASGAPPIAGLISGIIGGIVVGLISKSHTSISGPAAGLSAIVLGTIASLGAYETFLLAVVIGGAIQILMGIMRLGILANYFPSSVIKGLLASIGLLIIYKEFPHLIGFDQEKKMDLSAHMFDGNPFDNTGYILSHFHPGALLIGVLTVLTIIIWDNVKILKKSMIPGPLVVIVLGIGTYYFTFGFDALRLGAEHMVNVPVSRSFGEFIGQLKHPDFAMIGRMEVWIAAITIAGVASLETLLNIEAVDKLDRHSRNTPQSWELIAQGIGNTVAGLVGGIPVTSVVIRGSVGISSGGETKKTAIIHGLLLFAFVLFLPRYLNLIPRATLAGILVMTGYKLAKPSLFVDTLKKGMVQFIPFIVTIIAIIGKDLPIGIGIGLALGLIFVLRSDIKSALLVTDEKHYNENVSRLVLPQIASFINKAKMRDILNHVPRNSKIIIDASDTRYIDGDILEIIKNFKYIMAPEKNISLSMVGFKNKYGLNDEFKHAHVMTKELQSLLTPKEVLNILMEGNKRFVTGSKIEKNISSQMNVTSADGQHPLAVVLSCIDSRTTTEIIFDLGMGDVFAIRIAGNVVNEDIIASMEFACKIAGAKLIVVLGHTECGAIKGACDNLDIGNLGKLFEKIKPAIDAEYATRKDRNSTNELYVKNVTRLNVHHNIFHIAENSHVLADMINNGEVGIIGGIYDIKTGEVKFTPMYESHAVSV